MCFQSFVNKERQTATRSGVLFSQVRSSHKTCLNQLVKSEKFCSCSRCLALRWHAISSSSSTKLSRKSYHPSARTSSLLTIAELRVLTELFRDMVQREDIRDRSYQAAAAQRVATGEEFPGKQFVESIHHLVSEGCIKLVGESRHEIEHGRRIGGEIVDREQ